MPFDMSRSTKVIAIYWVCFGITLTLILVFPLEHGMQIFQRLSDAMGFMMHSCGFQVVAYVNDYLGFGTPSVASLSFDALYELLQELGLTISNKKLVAPSTSVVCLRGHD